MIARGEVTGFLWWKKPASALKSFKNSFLARISDVRCFPLHSKQVFTRERLVLFDKVSYTAFLESYRTEIKGKCAFPCFQKANPVQIAPKTLCGHSASN